MIGRVLFKLNLPRRCALSRYVSLSIFNSSDMKCLARSKQFSRRSWGMPLNSKFCLLLLSSLSSDLYSSSLSLSCWDFSTVSILETLEFKLRIESSLVWMELTLPSFTASLFIICKSLSSAVMCSKWLTSPPCTKNSSFWDKSRFIWSLYPSLLIFFRLDCFPRT